MKNKKIFGLIVLLLIIISMVLIIVLKDKPNEDNKNYSSYKVGFELLASESFNKEEVLSRGYPVLLDIGGEDCIPCKAMKPVLVELNQEWQGKIIVKFVDYWKYPSLANQFDFSVIPTQFFYDEKGELYKTHQGQIEKKEVIRIFKEMGYDFNE